jgi:dihydroorotate dehydrogenase
LDKVASAEEAARFIKNGMRWVAILRGRVHADLAATSGIHRTADVIEMTMAGADVTMLCSVLLRRGIDHIRVIENEIKEWLQVNEYDSLEQLKGSMSQEVVRIPRLSSGRSTSVAFRPLGAR